MTTGVVLLNFGEPAEPEREAVVDYLQLIFLSNADLEDAEDPEARARELAERRAPALLEEYEAIGGSPLNEQAMAQAERLQSLLVEQGHDVQTFVGMQYTEPFIEQAVATARAEGVDELVALPVYPLCGPSTTVLALDVLQEALADQDWDVPVQELTGWHPHPTYQALRADAIRDYVDEAGVDLDDYGTGLVFSAHGTPQHYLEAGSRYDEYVREWCLEMKDRLLLDDYFLAYQNHENRDIPWTEPDVEDLVADLGDSGIERIVVEPVSFLHEQSETLSELDVELREAAEAVGLEFHRVPIPHDDERIEHLFADLLDPFLTDTDVERETRFAQCECRTRPGTMCLNAPHGD
jgi:ferrochelatase